MRARQTTAPSWWLLAVSGRRGSPSDGPETARRWIRSRLTAGSVHRLRPVATQLWMSSGASASCGSCASSPWLPSPCVAPYRTQTKAPDALDTGRCRSPPSAGIARLSWSAHHTSPRCFPLRSRHAVHEVLGTMARLSPAGKARAATSGARGRTSTPSAREAWAFCGQWLADLQRSVEGAWLPARSAPAFPAVPCRIWHVGRGSRRSQRLAPAFSPVLRRHERADPTPARSLATSRIP